MAPIAVPNVSEGRRPEVVSSLRLVLVEAGLTVLDTHSDADHNRTVFTVWADNSDLLVEGCLSLALAARDAIDLRSHQGVHPYVGALDVWPFVPFRSTMPEAVEAARLAAGRVGAAGLPVYLYGEAARRHATRNLPDLRRGGLEGLRARAAGELPPDEGPGLLDPRAGAVCIGARGPLVAFNVWTDADLAVAKAAAGEVRGPAIRALGLRAGSGTQVSMNLIDPAVLGIDAAFEATAVALRGKGATVVGTEIVGLVEERFLPEPGKEAARLLIEPGRSLEQALSS